VLLETSSASLALSIKVLAGSALRADTHTVADLDISFDLGTDADGGTDELVADAAWVVGGSLLNVSDTFPRKTSDAILPIRCEGCASRSHRYRSERS
jgi:hypothetical protein